MNPAMAVQICTRTPHFANRRFSCDAMFWRRFGPALARLPFWVMVPKLLLLTRFGADRDGDVPRRFI